MILLVERVYDTVWPWVLPGGIIEADESPLGACRREIREELGIDPIIEHLAAIDWVPPRPPKTADNMYLFTGHLPAQARIRLDPAELSAWTWVTPAAAQPGQNPPSLLLGATQFLLANYSDHPLIQFYLALTGQAAPTGDPCPTLREFVLAHREQITKIVATRLVQPNEPARSAYRYPALLTAQRLGGRPLALIEIGPSAGLTLVPTDTPTTTAPCTVSPPRHWS